MYDSLNLPAFEELTQWAKALKGERHFIPALKGRAIEEARLAGTFEIASRFKFPAFELPRPLGRRKEN